MTGIYVLAYANRPFQGKLGSTAIFSAHEQIMAITRLHVEGYRSIKSVWLKLKPVNVLVELKKVDGATTVIGANLEGLVNADD